MAPKKSKKVRRNRLILALAVLVLLVYMGSIILSDIQAINQQNRLLDAKMAEVQRQKAENDELARIIESGTEEERLERVARDKLGYVDPNERVYVDTAG